MILLLILVLAFILRLINLNQSLWLDEAVQAITSAGPLSGILPELIGDFHPPLYHYFMWGWVHLFGSSEVILRLPSVVFGVGTVWFGYKIASVISNQLSVISNNKPITLPRRQAGDRWLPITSIVLFATSPYLIYYSQEARMYSLSVFLTTLSSYLFIMLVRQIDSQNFQPKAGQPLAEKNKKQKAITIYYLLITTLLVYTDYYGWLVILAQSLLLLYRKSFKTLILNSVFLILFYLPWLNMLITQMKAGVLATQTLPVWASLVNLSVYKAIPLTFIKFTLGRISFPDKQYYLLVVLVVTVVYVVLGILGGLGIFPGKFRVQNLLGKGKKGYFGYILLWFFIPLFLAWLVSFKVPNFQPFRLLLILPAFHLLTAYLIVNIKQMRVRWLLFIIVVSINLSGYLYFQITPSMQREDWRGLTSYTDSQKATLLIPSESSNWPVQYYTDGGTTMVYGAIGAQRVEQPPVLGGNTIYFLRYLVPVFDASEKIQSQLNLSGYQKTDTINFNQLEIWKYERSNQ